MSMLKRFIIKHWFLMVIFVNISACVSFMGMQNTPVLKLFCGLIVFAWGVVGLVIELGVMPRCTDGQSGGES